MSKNKKRRDKRRFLSFFVYGGVLRRERTKTPFSPPLLPYHLPHYYFFAVILVLKVQIFALAEKLFIFW
jgi:hypothetical protein